MSRPSSDDPYRPRTLVPARTLRRRTDAPSFVARVGFVVAVVAAASFPLAAVAVAVTWTVSVVVRRRSRRSADGTTLRVPGVAVEVTVARTADE